MGRSLKLMKLFILKQLLRVLQIKYLIQATTFKGSVNLLFILLIKLFTNCKLHGGTMLSGSDPTFWFYRPLLPTVIKQWLCNRKK